MPWIPYQKSPGETPAHYEFPYLSDDIVLGHDDMLEIAKSKRKECGQIRESLLGAQKLCTKETREMARAISNIAADYMKEQRAWDFLVRFIQGEEAIVNYLRPSIQKEIASYLDSACNILVYS